MATLKASPGQWVQVPVADAWPVSMAIGDEPPRPAFIDHVQGRRGRVDTYAKRRCPDLRPGRYTVRVESADGVTEVPLQVV